MCSRVNTYVTRPSRSWTTSDGDYGFNQGDVDTVCGYRAILGYRGPRQSGTVHSCDHTIVQFAPIRAATDWQGWGRTAKLASYLAGTLSISGDTSISPSAYDAIIQDLVGEIPTDVLLPNLVLELPQTLTLHKALAGTVSDLARRIKVGKSLADSGLSYSFGLKPLASDLSKLVGLSRRVSKRVQYLSKLSADDYTSFRRSLPVTKQPTVGFAGDWWTNNYGSDPNSQVLSTETTADAQVFARIIRTRRISPETEKARAMLDATGLSQAGSVLWEAIPFSFVADWFFPAGRALNFLNQQAFEGACAYANAGYQSHMQSTVEVKRNPYMYSSEFKMLSAKPVIGAGTIRYYLRRAGLPATNSGYHYGVSQGVLSGMLALQKMG